MGEAVVMALLTVWTAARAAECEGPTSLADVSTRAAEVEAAWADLDGEAMARADESLVHDVTCLGVALGPLDAARFFRVHGYAQFVANREDQALDAFRAARAIQPHYALPTTLAGPNHPMRVLWDEASKLPIESPPAPLPPPADGWTAIDGKASDLAPSNRAYLFQHLSPTGAAVATSMQGMGTIPSYALQAPPKKISRAWLARGAVVGGVGVALIGAAGGTRIAYNSIPVERGPLTGLRYTNYALGGAGLTFAAVGTAFGTAALVAWDW